MNKEKKKTVVQGTTFFASELNSIMHAVDLDDNGSKMFGNFQEFNFTTTKEVDAEYKQNMVKHLLAFGEKSIGFALIDDYFAFKPKLTALSLGTHFIWVEDYRKQLIEKGMKEVEIANN